MLKEIEFLNLPACYDGKGYSASIALYYSKIYGEKQLTRYETNSVAVMVLDEWLFWWLKLMQEDSYR